MNISKIDINNFRLLKQTSINCEKELSLIIGKNNCGKTSLLSALSKCIGSKSEVGKFNYFDFSMAFQNRLYDVIDGKNDFSEDELKGIQIDIYIEYGNEDDLTNISELFLDLDPDNKTVVLRFCYFLKDIEKLRDDFNAYRNSRKNLSNEKAFTKFMDKKHKIYFEFKRYSVLYNHLKGEVDNDIYKFIDNKDIDISKIIAFSYVGARRNVSNTEDEELSTLAGMYYERTKDMESNNTRISGEFEDALDKTDEEFSGIYVNVFQQLTERISEFGGMRKNETVLKVISRIKEMNLLRNNTTVVYGNQNGTLPENYNGLGFLNLFSIIMNIEIKLCDFRKESKKDESPADINLLFIEEPEAHTHPQMQYIFIKNIKKLLEEGRKINKSEKKINLQTFMTTHSSHIVAECDFDDIKYFFKTNEGDNVISKNLSDLEIMYQKEKGSKNNHFKFLKQYLTLNRAEVFFADKIVLIEGDTERILLPAMIKKLDQENEYDIPLSSQNISIIEVGNYAEIYAEFIQFIGIKTLIITDIDTECYQTNKDNKPTLQASRVNDGTHTSNPAIKYYLKKRLEIDSQNTKNKTEMEDQKASEKYILTNLTLTDKIITGIYDDNGNLSWESDENGNVLIVYKIKEYNKDGKEYNARSFEDAFFHLNRNLFTERGKKTKKENITQCNSDFQGLKNVKKIFNKSVDSYDLAKDCVNKKTSFAMDILLNSESVDGKDFANWEIPSYIKEGLEWLQK